MLIVAPLFIFTSRILAAKAPDDSASSYPLVSVVLASSRTNPAAGTGLGITGVVKNMSNVTIYFRADSLTVTMPPELEGPFVNMYATYAFLPTETSVGQDTYKSYVVLHSGDSYEVIWQLGKTSSKPNDFELSTSIWQILQNVRSEVLSELDYLFFSPGEYQIKASLKYWTDPAMPKDKYRVVFQNINLNVGAPQFVILFGAALGGLIAYFIVPAARQKLISLALPPGLGPVGALLSRIASEVAGIMGSVLLSAIVTVLLSRMAESQFLIRVTVNDLWGAMAIGFAANYGGSEALRRLVKGKGDDGAAKQGGGA